MGAIQMAMTIWAMVAIRDADQPLWFWIAGIVVMVPAAWYGGWHRGKRTARPTAGFGQSPPPPPLN
ncbi:MAG TPA: hypothetical protein VI485_30110 [Vicinamibacterales bacterium]|nr:hypothetical protein [Vicinamibacterales bacterium]